MSYDLWLSTQPEDAQFERWLDLNEDITEGLSDSDVEALYDKWTEDHADDYREAEDNYDF